MKKWMICVAIGIVFLGFVGGWYLGANGKLLPHLSAFGELRDSERELARAVDKIGREKAVLIKFAREYEKQLAADQKRDAEREDRIRELEDLLGRERQALEREREIARAARTALEKAESGLRGAEEGVGEASGSLDIAIGAGEEMGELILRLREQLRGLQEGEPGGAD